MIQTAALVYHFKSLRWILVSWQRRIEWLELIPRGEERAYPDLPLHALEPREQTL